MGGGVSMGVMTPTNILVRMPNWIGDLVMATPLLLDLRDRFPEARITAMSLSPLCELLKKEEAIDEVFSFRRPANKFDRRMENRSIIGKLREGKYDLGILAPRSFSSAWWFWQGKVARRIGFEGRWRRWLLTDPLSFPKEKEHLTQTYKRLLEPLGIERSATKPRLLFSKEEKEAVEQLLMQRGFKKNGKLLAIHPGAAYGWAKSWPIERFRSLVEALSKKEGLFIAVLGDPAMRPLVQDICRGLPKRVIDLAGATNLRELGALIGLSDLLVANDSGPMHIATAVNTPLVALFGSTDEEITGPYGRPEFVLSKKVACSPCFRKVCPIDFRCMKNISVEEVLERVEKILY